MNKDKLRKLFNNTGLHCSDGVDPCSGDDEEAENEAIDQILQLHNEEMRRLLESMPPKPNIDGLGGYGAAIALARYVDETLNWQSQKLKELGGKDE